MAEKSERRAPMQASPFAGKQAGTIAWSEHLKIWKLYAAKWGSYQSAERIAARGGFAFGEATELLGYEPTTWKRRWLPGEKR